MTSLPAPLAVFIGGSAGGALRLGLDQWIAPARDGLPLDIVAINVLGAFALGLLTAWRQPRDQQWWLPLLGTGALGGFTTFSALAALPWLSDVGVAWACGLLVVTMAVAALAAGAGWALGERAARASRSSANGVA